MKKVKIFQPIESMNPLYLGSLEEELYNEILKEHNIQTMAEVKEDGYRIQVHKKGNKIKAYTRSMNEVILELFPELQSSFKKLPNCIIDCELAGYGKIGHEGFNSVKRRFRHKISEKGLEEYLNSDIRKELPLTVRVFDTLYWEDKQMLDLPLYERRKITEKISERRIKPSKQRIIKTSKALGKWFNKLVNDHYEGLVCKNPNSLYLPGKRTTDWIKLKRSETMDLVVLGVYMEDSQISQLLCGSYNPETNRFETLTKVNAKREGMNKEIYPLLEGYFRTSPEQIDIKPELNKPDYFINPADSIVVEVAAMNIQRTKNIYSCGLKNSKSYSLRIAWLKQVRDDKKPLQATTTEQIAELYKKEKSD